jgi:uncharacterized membrane protein YqjE
VRGFLGTQAGYRGPNLTNLESEAHMADHETSDLRERPASELLRQLSDQTTALVRQEIELAKLEFREKGKKAGMGAGMFGGAGVFGLYAVGALTATIILALATFLPAWVAALIVTVVYGAIAGVLALRGKAQVEEATPPVPEQAVETTKEDVRWVKTRAQSAREH